MKLFSGCKISMLATAFLATAASVTFAQDADCQNNRESCGGYWRLDLTNESDVIVQTRRFEAELRRMDPSAALDTCDKMLLLAVGTAHGNNSYGAICRLSSSEPPKLVMICFDEMVGHFAAKSGGFAVSRPEVARFTLENCTGG